MNWELLTSPDFEKAVETCGNVCLLPFGVVEKHGDHLPMGMDIIYAHEVSTRAAQAEPAMVFPPFYFGQILEAKHVPGTIALKGKLLIALLENVCDEIGRNGFDKIVIVNGHGGNTALIKFFLQLLLEKQKPYMVFLSDYEHENPAAAKLRKAEVDGHGGEEETCSMMYLRPELVHASRFGSYGLPLKRLEKFATAGLASGIWWYAEFPGHFAGNKVKLTRKKGEVFVKGHVKHIARQIKLVKSDTTPMKLYREFLLRAQSPANRYP